jgi:CrcB protein
LFLQKAVWIAFAGACGTFLRYVVGSWIPNHWGNTFPWATWIINGTGCFLFGLVWTLAEERFLISSEWRVIALTGFMGGYTTFSSYMFEASQMIREAQWLGAVAIFAGENISGLVLMMLGFALGRAL